MPGIDSSGCQHPIMRFLLAPRGFSQLLVTRHKIRSIILKINVQAITTGGAKVDRPAKATAISAVIAVPNANTEAAKALIQDPASARVPLLGPSSS